MKMQMKALAASCALIAANQALALNANVAVGAQLFLSGSSALNTDLVTQVAGTLCNAGTYDLYLDNGGGGDERLVVCTGSASAGTASGKNLFVYIRSNGGSFFGTSPVGTTAIKRYDVTANAGCPAAGPVTIGATVTGGAKCTGWVAAAPAGVIVSQVPDVGISDEEPALFTNILNTPAPATCTTGPFADTACPPAATNYTSKSILVQAMGIVVTNQLQSALIAAGSSNPSGRANMASSWITDAFSKSSGVYTAAAGNGDWAGLSDRVLSTTGASTTAAFSGAVKICRRAAGSGTQAALQAHFLNVGCSGFVQTPAAASDSFDPGTGPTYSVVENSSSGAVKSCMDAAFSAGTKAIGILSLDQSVVAGHYDFVTLDGVNPTDPTITNGAYPYVVESKMQIANGLTGDKSAVANGLLAALQNVTTQSANGVYNILPAAGAPTGNTAPKTMKGSNGGSTCTPLLF